MPKFEIVVDTSAKSLSIKKDGEEIFPDEFVTSLHKDFEGDLRYFTSYTVMEDGMTVIRMAGFTIPKEDYGSDASEETDGKEIIIKANIPNEVGRLIKKLNAAGQLSRLFTTKAPSHLPGKKPKKDMRKKKDKNNDEKC